jgi:hypothetical protein
MSTSPKNSVFLQIFRRNCCLFNARLFQPPWLHHPNDVWWRIRLQITNFLTVQLFQPPVMSPMLGPNFILSSIFFDIFNLCLFLTAKDQVSHPYEATSKIIALCVLKFTFIYIYTTYRRRRKNYSELSESKRFSNFFLSFWNRWRSFDRRAITITYTMHLEAVNILSSFKPTIKLLLCLYLP